MSIPEDKMLEIFQSLPDNDKQEVYDFASYLNEKRIKAIRESFKSASIDDEPLSEEFIKGLEEAEEDIKAGRVISADDVFKKAKLK